MLITKNLISSTDTVYYAFMMEKNYVLHKAALYLIISSTISCEINCKITIMLNTLIVACFEEFLRCNNDRKFLL